MMIYVFMIVCIFILVIFEKSIQEFFITYVYEKDLQLYLNYKADVSFDDFQHSRYKKSGRLALLLMVLPLIDFNKIYLTITLLLIVYEYKRPFYKLKKDYADNLSLVRYQFPIWLRQIQVLLHNNNVMSALKLSLPLAPNIIKDDLELLIQKLENNPNDISVFVDFMNYFSISEIDRAMKLLYRTYVVDKQESSKQLNRMIVSTTKWIRQERLVRHENRLAVFEWIGIIPLLGVTLVFLVIMASLINNLFGKGVSM